MPKITYTDNDEHTRAGARALSSAIYKKRKWFNGIFSSSFKNENSSRVFFLRCFVVNSHKSARLAHNENDKDYFCADVVVYERAPFQIYNNEKITDLIYLFKSDKKKNRTRYQK